MTNIHPPSQTEADLAAEMAAAGRRGPPRRARPSPPPTRSSAREQAAKAAAEAEADRLAAEARAIQQQIEEQREALRRRLPMRKPPPSSRAWTRRCTAAADAAIAAAGGAVDELAAAASEPEPEASLDPAAAERARVAAMRARADAAAAAASAAAAAGADASGDEPRAGVCRGRLRRAWRAVDYDRAARAERLVAERAAAAAASEAAGLAPGFIPGPGFVPGQQQAAREEPPPPPPGGDGARRGRHSREDIDARAPSRRERHVHRVRVRRLGAARGEDDAAHLWRRARPAARVSIPRAASVPARYEMSAIRGDSGNWRIEVQQVGGGWRYAFEVTMPGGHAFTRRDPWARETDFESDVCFVVDPDSFRFPTVQTARARRPGDVPVPRGHLHGPRRPRARHRSRDVRRARAQA